MLYHFQKIKPYLSCVKASAQIWFYFLEMVLNPLAANARLWSSKIVCIRRLVVLVCLLFGHYLFGENAYTEIKNEATLSVLTPSLSLRQSEKIRLNNGLEAYLISDKKADKSAAALTVKVGSWNEPKDHPGLAHFLEHMLFMGTEKYPDESAFDEYLKDHGGTTNAFTAEAFTSYLFDVDNEAFEGALDRFSQFFKSPSFNASGVGRELKAIDHEYMGLVENDSMREYQILKELSNPSHPFHHFSVGNSESLSSVSRETLISWYKENYSSDLMRLVVISPLSVDALKSIVIKDFSGIKKSETSPQVVKESIKDSAQLGHIAYIEPIKNRRVLSLIWELPAQFVVLDSRPESIICSILGDEGPGSLLAELKGEGLAESIACGTVVNTEHLKLLYLTVGLTIEGVEKVNSVVEKIFQALALLKQDVPSYLFDDQKGLQQLNYQYQSRQTPFDEATLHASLLANEPMSTYPERSFILHRFDPELIMALSHYLTPENAYYQLVAPSALTGMTSTRKEAWMGGAFSLKPIEDGQRTLWSQARAVKNISLPAPNPFIPTNLKIENPQFEPSAPLPKPIALLDNEQGLVYYAPDNEFGLPEIDYRFYFKTPSVNPGPYKAALTDLYAKYMTDLLSTSTYPAMLAGLSFEIKRDDYGLYLHITGYSDKAPLLLDEVLKGFKTATFESDRFNRVRLSLLDEYNNKGKAQAYEIAAEWLNDALLKGFSRAATKAAFLEKIDIEEFARFSKGLFKKAYCQALLYGNITKEEAALVLDAALSSLESEPYPLGKTIKNSPLVLPADKGPFLFERSVHVQGNAVILAIENGPFDHKSRAMQQIMARAMEAPFFHDLRTQQQTGYIVTNYASDIEKELFSYFLTQSNTHEPGQLVARFELFLEGFLQELGKGAFPEERFEKIRNSLIAEFKHPAQNQNEMSELLYKIAFKFDADFEWVEKRIEALKNLSYEECLKWALLQYGVHNKRRLAICIKGKTDPNNILDYHKVKTLRQLRLLSK